MRVIEKNNLLHHMASCREHHLPLAVRTEVAAAGAAALPRDGASECISKPSELQICSPLLAPAGLLRQKLSMHMGTNNS